jgi:hypothetical protein
LFEINVSDIDKSKNVIAWHPVDAFESQEIFMCVTFKEGCVAWLKISQGKIGDKPWSVFHASKDNEYANILASHGWNLNAGARPAENMGLSSGGVRSSSNGGLRIVNSWRGAGILLLEIESFGARCVLAQS